MSDSTTSSRSPFSSQSLLLYKITTGLTYLLLVVTTFYYTFNKPHEGHKPHGRFWQHNYATPFAQSSIITSIYWCATLSPLPLHLPSPWLTRFQDRPLHPAARLRRLSLERKHRLHHCRGQHWRSLHCI
jgi:hypothetical protein